MTFQILVNKKTNKKEKKMKMSKSNVGFILRFQKSVGLVLKADASVTALQCDCPSSATKFGKITLDYLLLHIHIYR